jgi:hypothetical protein
MRTDCPSVVQAICVVCVVVASMNTQLVLLACSICSAAEEPARYDVCMCIDRIVVVSAESVSC